MAVTGEEDLLDAARTGRPENRDVVAAIAEAVATLLAEQGLSTTRVTAVAVGGSTVIILGVLAAACTTESELPIDDPDAVDTEVALPLQTAYAELDGVKEVQSFSQQNAFAVIAGSLLIFAQLQSHSSYVSLLPGMVLGGLGMATVAANAVFASITGSSIASASVFTRISVPEMRRLGYNPRFSVGVVAGSSVLGMLIPPSVLLIVWAILTEMSVGALFIAGIFFL